MGRPTLKGGQDVYVDSVIEDAIIYNSGGPHLGAYTGPLFNVFFHLGGNPQKLTPLGRFFTLFEHFLPPLCELFEMGNIIST